MKTMLKKLRKLFVGGALIGLAACNEPYDQAVNANAQPAVVLVSFRDQVAFDTGNLLPGAAGTAFFLDVGPADVLVPPTAAKTGESTSEGPVVGTGLVFGSITIPNTSEANPPASIALSPNDPVTPGNGNPPYATLYYTGGALGIDQVQRDALIYPFIQPRLEFNKLLNGDTVEETATDPSTGKQIGECVMVPGVMTLAYTTTNPEDTASGNAPTLQACYSPSDLLVTLAAAETPPDFSAALPDDFLHYSAAYTLKTTSAIKDKQNKGLTPFTLTFQTSPFELIEVVSRSAAVQAYASPDSGLSLGSCVVDSDCAPIEACQNVGTDTAPKMGCEDGSACSTDADCAQLAVCEPNGFCSDTANVINNAKAAPQTVQLIFSGPVGPTAAAIADSQSDAAAAAAADASTADVTIYPVPATPNTAVLNDPTAPVVFVVNDTDGTETALQSGGTFPFIGDQLTTDASARNSDPRILFLIHPDVVAAGLAGTATKTGFATGHYRVHLPLSFTDNGSVTGTPVPLACADGSGGSSGTPATCTDVTFDFFIGPIPAR